MKSCRFQALGNTSGPACAGLYWRAMVAGGINMNQFEGRAERINITMPKNY